MSNYWKDKKVLITGSSGFIGSHMVKALIKRGAIVTACISERTTAKVVKDKLFDIPKNRVKKTNLLDLNACISLAKGQHVILNFAAVDGSAQFKKDHCAEIFRINTQIVFNLLEASRLTKIERILLISSIEVYDQGLTGKITEKSKILDKVTNSTVGYGLSKRTSEIAAKLYSEQYGLKIAIARPGNVYGPDDYTDNEKSRVISTFIKRALNKEPIVIFGNGLQKRSFLYIDDLIIALLLLVEKYSTADPVNIASSREITIRKLAKTIVKLVGTKSKIIFKEHSEIDMKKRKRTISSQKAKDILNFKENQVLENGLQKTIESIRKKI